ncbi:hypothetical protein [Methanohalophilus euhalobius]|uniref:Uncharacterized protein n=2 Tax=Methanohalophilus euhalobius TaxID=51203 RepID=A0A314ZYI2_9EURY|nr:hypothetical protein [Methanohalophilus euhalobius]PQV43730.1 hypothetical protein B0H22_101149 [Methanohalophilus euhalobius]
MKSVNLMPKTLDIAEFRNMIEKTKKLHEDLSSLSHKMDDMDDEVKCDRDYGLSRRSSELYYKSDLLSADKRKGK